ncbi:MAG: hypothetical protein ACI4D4_00575 [Lachnospira sp.]
MSTSKSRQNLSSKYASSTKGNAGLAKKSTRLTPSIVSVSVVLIVSIVVVAVVAVVGRGGLKKSAQTYNLVVTPDNIEELRAANRETVAPGSYDVSMNSTWNFSNARSASSNAFVQNLLSNSNTVKFTVKRKDSGNVIYTSPYIPVGSSLSNIKLEDGSLNKGTYPCVVTYHLVDEEYRELSSVSINISVVIEND